MSERSITPTLFGPLEHGISAAETIASGDAPPSKRGPGLSRGASLGRYIVLEMLGRGGMGVVYAAYDPQLDRKLAIKVILPGRDDRVAARLRLQREAQAIAQLAHPNVVAVHDVGAVDGQVFIAMEFVDGSDLGRWLTSEKRSPATVLDMFLQAGKGLAAAHAAGLVHRDFKPENVLVGRDGRARVVDFGLVRRDENSMSRPPSMSDPDWQSISQQHAKIGQSIQLTDAGSMVGTPAYMSPEQFAGLPGDARADQFSFCVSLYEGLYGERPFEGDNPADLAYSVGEGTIRPPPAKHEVSNRLRRILVRGLSVEPIDRYPGMEALLAALRKAAAPRRLWMAIPVLGVIGGGAALAVAASPAKTDPCTSVAEPADLLWTPTRKDQLDMAFHATGRPFADATWERVQGDIDDYLSEWKQLQVEVCESNVGLNAETRANDPRQQCLDDRLLEVSDLLSVFEQASESTVTSAVRMTHRLSSLERCSKHDALELRPKPVEPEMRAKVSRIRSGLRRWELSTLGGHDDTTDQQLADLSAEAEALGFEPLIAELRNYQSNKISENGGLERSIELSNEAFELALASRHDRLAAGVANGLVHTHGVARREAVVAHRWARRSEALQRRIGQDPQIKVALLNSEASVYAIEGKGDEARELYEEALDLARKLDDPVMLAAILGNVGAFHAEERRLLQAHGYIEEALSLSRDILGPDHPQVLRTQVNLAIVAMMSGETQEGLDLLEEALPRQEAVYGPNNIEVANTLDAIGTTLARLGQLERAIALRRRVLKIRLDALGADAHRTVDAHIGLANALIEAQHPQQALDVLLPVRAKLDSRDDAPHQLDVDTDIAISRCYRKLSQALRDDEAETRANYIESSRRHGESALTTCRNHDSCVVRRLRDAITTAASSRLLGGDPDGARELFEEVLRMPAPEEHAWSHPAARFGLARATLDKDPEGALALARQAQAELNAIDLNEDHRARTYATEVGKWLDEHER